MRHSDQGGRFTVPWEHYDIFKGIDGDLRAEVGQHVQWVVYDPEASESDVIYDVGSKPVGRVWRDPVRVPAYAAIVYQGVSLHNERGFYNTDLLRVSVAADVMDQLLPDLPWEPDQHIKDRILYRGHIFIPTQINLRGILRDTHTIVTVEANQINEEEHVNDPVLIEWAHRSLGVPPNPYDPQKVKLSTSGFIG